MREYATGASGREAKFSLGQLREDGVILCDSLADRDVELGEAKDHLGSSSLSSSSLSSSDRDLLLDYTMLNIWAPCIVKGAH